MSMPQVFYVYLILMLTAFQKYLFSLLHRSYFYSFLLFLQISVLVIFP